MDDEQDNESRVLLLNGSESRAVADRLPVETSLSSNAGANSVPAETLG